MDTLIPIGQPAPGFSLLDLQGGIHRLEEARGGILVLNFWSAECPWAERADREVANLLQMWGKGVLLWTVASNVNEPVALLKRVAGSRSLPLLLHDSRQQVTDLFGAQTTPHFFVLDQQGLLRYQGALDDVTFRQREARRFYLHEAVQALLEGRLPDPAETPAYGCSIVRH
jgi:peroxiredoxin